jgi:phosphohistidine phosphatase
MRELLLLRHAKSSWDDAALADFDRPLAGRGREGAPAIGRLMARRGWIPDHAIVSPALRTRQTWDLVRAALPASRGAGPATLYDETIYEAPPEAILAAIRAAPRKSRRLLVVGHNPGLERLAILLAGPGSDAKALARLERKFPTAALARFAIEGADWRNLAGGGARLAGFVRPKDLPAHS